MNTEDMFKSLKKYSLEKPYLNTEMGQYAFQLGFEEGDKCASKNMIDKACEIAKDILGSYSFVNYPREMQDFLVDFREAMEE